MSERFKPGDVWEASFDRDVWAVYYLVGTRQLPKSGSDETWTAWDVIVLQGEVAVESKIGQLVQRDFSDIHFVDGGALGFDMYDNCYQRIA